MARALDTSPSIERAKKAGVLQPLPRRTRIGTADDNVSGLEDRRAKLPEPQAKMIVAGLFRLAFAVFLFVVETIGAQFSGDASIKSRGQRLRRVFERIGGTAIKIGQQLAVRVDFFPFELCEELAKLMDRVHPFATEEAIELIEAAAGAPIAEIFDRFEPVPIGSASIACVYRGRLRSGEEVAIKVRRPGVEHRFITDLFILDMVTKLAEQLTLVRPKTFEGLRTEMRNMFLEELDFQKEATFQTAFRRLAQRDRINWVSAPRVIARLSSHNVLTTEFIRGYSCIDVLRIVDTQHQRDLAILASVGIDPKVIGDRIIELSLWMRLECPFFHSDPHPGNLIILPGNRIVMLDFGACGLVTKKQASGEIEVSRCMANDDIAGAAGAMLQIMSPLPEVDLARLRKALERSLWNLQVTLRSSDAAWWERTSAQTTMIISAALKEFNIPPDMAQLRFARANLLYDTIAIRLNPTINFTKAFRAWLRRSKRRAQRRDLKRVDRMRPAQKLGQELKDLAATLQNGLYVATSLARVLPEQFVAAQSKGAFIAGVFLRLIFSVAFILSAAALAVLLSQGFQATPQAYIDLAGRGLSHPLVLVGCAVLAYFALRRIQARLSDRD